MRVLVIHSRYLSGSVSGENRVVEDEVELLRNGGHDVHTWTPSVTESGFGLVRRGIDAVWSRSAVDQIRSLVRDQQPDVVHCHNLFPALSPAVLRAVGATPLVVTLHNYRLLCLPSTFVREGRVCESCLGHAPWRGVVHGCYRGSMPASAAIATSLTLHRAADTFSRPDLYLAVSDFVRRKHIAAGFDADRIQVKPNFTWAAPVREGPGDYFLFLGRLTSEKGPQTAIDAISRLGGSRLVVVGDGPDHEALRAFAHPAVEFRGPVDGAEVPEILRRARALLVPSTWYEGAPRSILEAFAAGVPVIASRIGGLPELVEDGVTGFLVAPNQPTDWAEAMARFCDDTEAIQMGLAAHRTWKERFGPDEGLRNLEEAYRAARSAQEAAVGRANSVRTRMAR
jgi:glycosyltransferase involved in cell wall biosynthesis